MKRAYVDCGSLSLWVLPDITLFYLPPVLTGGFEATHGSPRLEVWLGRVAVGGHGGRGAVAINEMAGQRQASKSKPPLMPAGGHSNHEPAVFLCQWYSGGHFSLSQNYLYLECVPAARLCQCAVTGAWPRFSAVSGIWKGSVALRLETVKMWPKDIFSVID